MGFQFLSFLLLAGSVIASSSSNNTALDKPDPCLVITSLITDFNSDTSNSGQPFRFSPELGFQCLQSSTIDNNLASSYAKELKKYYEFQSTLAYLNAPPTEAYYPWPTVDILGGLDDLATKAATGGWESQYEFDQALFLLLASAHEGHLFANPCTSSSIIFVRGVSFVSVSVDGIELPQIFALDDVVSGAPNISNVLLINGEDAVTVIESEAFLQMSDPDASYNAMFYNVGRTPNAGSPLGSFTTPSSYSYPGVSTYVTFSNGSTFEFANRAAILSGTWSEDIVDGESFTNFFCIEPAQPSSTSTPPINNSSSTTATASSAATSATSTSKPDFPSTFPYTPIVSDPNNQVAGYFLNGTGYEDTAVLWVASFEQTPDHSDPATITQSFVNTTIEFFATLRSSNKTNLIIDLSGNGGGSVVLSYDLFRRLFPDLDPNGSSRCRVPIAADICGQTLEAIPDSLFYPTAEQLQSGDYQIAGGLFSSPYDYRGQLTTDFQNFTSWHELYPPNVQNGDNFTVNYQMPLNNAFYDLVIGNTIPYGYANNPATFPQPFLVENIVILTEGYCASACTIFAEFLTRVANVKTIAVGGRPKNGPMQAIGGTKGTLAAEFDLIAQTSQLIMNFSQYIPPDLLQTAQDTFPGLIDLPLGNPANLGKYGVNLQDSIPLDDDAQIPLQFVFEPADCRIFYTQETVLEQNALWQYAHDVAWNGKPCAWGGISSVTPTYKNGTAIKTETSGKKKRRIRS